MSKSDKEKKGKKNYDFGGVKEFSLEEIEKEILSETVYLDVFAGSDSRFKLNVEQYSTALEKINKLDAVKYTYNTEEFSDKKFPKEEQIGFIAQALKTVVPQAVREDDKGFHYVNYQMLVPVLTEAVKELNSKVENQGKLISKLEERLSALESQSVIEARNNSILTSTKEKES